MAVEEKLEQIRPDSQDPFKILLNGGIWYNLLKTEDRESSKF